MTNMQDDINRDRTLHAARACDGLPDCCVCREEFRRTTARESRRDACVSITGPEAMEIRYQFRRLAMTDWAIREAERLLSQRPTPTEQIDILKCLAIGQARRTAELQESLQKATQGKRPEPVFVRPTDPPATLLQNTMLVKHLVAGLYSRFVDWAITLLKLQK